MRASYTIDAASGCVLSTFEGRVTLPELGAHVRSVWSDPVWRSGYNGLLDFSAATLDLSSAEVQALTTSMASDPRCSFGRWALVVSTAADFAKLRKVDPAMDLRATLRIFFDRRSAEEWLLTSAGKPKESRNPAER